MTKSSYALSRISQSSLKFLSFDRITWSSSRRAKEKVSELNCLKNQKKIHQIYVWLLLLSLFKGSIRKRRCVNISYFTLSRFFQRLHNVWCLWIANICTVWISVYTIFSAETENVNEISKEKGYNWWLVERCLSILFFGKIDRNFIDF